MLEIFLTENNSVYEKLEILLTQRLGAKFEIMRTANSKPYIEGTPLHLSLSHSGSSALIAISDKPVGVDAEIIKERKYSSVLSRFTERERKEINNDITAFYENWTIKEAYIKLSGGTLAKDLKRLEYFGRSLFCDGEKVTCGYNALEIQSGKLLCTVCAEGYSAKEISAALIKLSKV